jgi:hypothetical protein
MSKARRASITDHNRERLRDRWWARGRGPLPPTAKRKAKPMNNPVIDRAEADARVETKTAPRVTLEGMKDKIARVEYINPESSPILTLAVVRMSNGFVVVGKSAPASPDNFDKDVGQRYAFDDAIKQLWQFEGYLLCEKLATGAA